MPALLLLASLATLPEAAIALPAGPEFVVLGQTTPALSHYIERHCTGLRPRLAQERLHKEVTARWTPPCQIHVHATRASYAQAVGGGNQTFASSMTRSEQGRVTLRRIDLCCERLDRAMAALPHETLHLMLVDEFGGNPPPRWLDEGFAVLTDPNEKQSLHRRDLALALRRQTRFSISHLLHMADYPSAERMAAFYGQSTSLVSYLLTRGSPSDLFRMARRAEEVGYERALWEAYELDTRSLEAGWTRYVLAAL